MNPTQLRLRSFGVFTELDLALPEGLVSILGEFRDAPLGVDSNGAGKSTLLLAIDVALFGAEGRSLAPYLSHGSEDQQMEVELEFEHRGDRFRVRRGWNGRGRGKPSLDLEVWKYEAEGLPDGPSHWEGWEPCTLNSIDATESLIESTLGLSRDTFRASSMLLQDAVAFPDVERRERKRLLGKALGIEVWARYLELARRDKREAEMRLSELAGRGEAAEQELSRLPEVREEHSDARVAVEALEWELREAEGALERSTERYRQAEGKIAERRAVEAELREAQAALLHLEETESAAREASEQMPMLGAARAELATSEQCAAAEQAYSEARAAYDRADSERQVVKAQITNAADVLGQTWLEANQLDAKVTELLGKIQILLGHEPAICELCQRPLDDTEARGRVSASYQTDAAEFKERATVLTEAAKEQELKLAALKVALGSLVKIPSPDDAAVRKARADQQERARLNERLAMLEERVAAAKDPEFIRRCEQARAHEAGLETKLEAIEAPPAEETEAIQREGLQARAQVNELQPKLRLAQARMAKAEGTLERLRALAAQLEGARAERVTLQATLAELVLHERAYSQAGIPALIIESSAVPALEQEATRILAQIGTPWRVELRTERALSSREGTADALDIVVIRDDGSEQEFRYFSGGEKQRIDLALRLALAHLLAHRRGAESKLLCVDEPRYLDAAGMAALVEVLREMTSVVPKVWLVSHDPSLRDAVDETLLVVNEGGVARVESALARAAVAA